VLIKVSMLGCPSRCGTESNDAFHKLGRSWTGTSDGGHKMRSCPVCSEPRTFIDISTSKRF
jgi:hypothetical protein